MTISESRIFRSILSKSIVLGSLLSPVVLNGDEPARISPGDVPSANRSAAKRVRVAAISFEPVKLALEANAARLAEAFEEAAANGAQIAVAPEGILEGYIVNEIIAGRIPAGRMREVAIAVDHPIIRKFQAQADRLDMCIVFGFAEKDGADVFNTALFIDDAGRICGKYRKMQLAEGCHPDWWFDRLGTQARAFDTPFGRCGILICNDRWNPLLAGILKADGARFLAIPSFGSTSRAQDDAVLARSVENGIPVIEANVGVTLVASGGKIVAVDRKRTGITYAEIDIPPASEPDHAERDRLEMRFLRERIREMPRRYRQTMEKNRSAVDRKNQPMPASLPDQGEGRPKS